MQKIIPAMLFCLFSYYSQAQLALYVAKDNHYSVLDFEKAFNENGVESKKKLEDKYGTNQKIVWQPATMDDANARNGFYVIIKCIYKDYYGNKTAIGIGGSKLDFAAAEKQAVKNIAIYFTGINLKGGYTVVEQNTYNFIELKPSAIAIIVYTKDKQGNKKVSNAVFNKVSISDIDYRKFKEANTRNTDRISVEIFRVIADKGKAEIIKSVITYNSIVTEQAKLIYANTENDLKEILAQNNVTILPNKYQIVKEINLEIVKSSSIETIYKDLQFKIKSLVANPESNKENHKKTVGDSRD